MMVANYELSFCVCVICFVVYRMFSIWIQTKLPDPKRPARRSTPPKAQASASDNPSPNDVADGITG